MRKSIWLTAMLVTLGSYCPIVACSNSDSTEVVAQGSIRLPLVAASAAGTQYRLSSASFQITGGPDGTTTNLSSNSAPSASVITATLPGGAYAMTLASIQSQTLTMVIYQFAVNGEVVQTGDGDVGVGIEVTEGTGGTAATGGTTATARQAVMVSS